MKLHFLGAAQEVTGSLYLVETASHKFLVDCGMFQGGENDDRRNRDDFPFEPSNIDALFLTHGHMDHVGRVPLLVRRGFRGPIWCTAPTGEIAKLIWEDILDIMKDDIKRAKKEKRDAPSMMFEEKDVQRAVRQLRSVDYGELLKVLGGEVGVTFHDAGHILGSSFIEFVVEGKKIVFSGDLGNVDMPILRSTADLGEPDILVIESTYGDRLHEDVATRTEVLQECIGTITEQPGTLVIPAFAIERTQEIMLTLHRLAEEGEIPKVPVFLDSPMAIAATEIYEDHPEYYNKKAHNEMLQGHRLFSLPGFVATSTVEMSKTINNVPMPKVIIAGSGMMSGGRIHHHLYRYLRDSNSILLIVGFQARGTLGREIYEGAQVVKILDEEVPVNAKVKAVGAWSAHADQKKLLSWVGEAGKKPGIIFATHGEKTAADALIDKFRDMHIEAHVPTPGQMCEFHEKGAVIH